MGDIDKLEKWIDEDIDECEKFIENADNHGREEQKRFYVDRKTVLLEIKGKIMHITGKTND